MADKSLWREVWDLFVIKFTAALILFTLLLLGVLASEVLYG